jgi:hypothetical protein
MVVHTCNLNTWEVEAERLQVPNQPGLCYETLSFKKKKKKKGNWDQVWWYTSVIPAALEAEMERLQLEAQFQARKLVRTHFNQ